MKKLFSKSTLGYAMFFIMTTLFFLFYLFPGEEFADHLEGRVSRADVGFLLTAETIAPRPPIGLQIIDSKIFHRAAGSNALLEAERITVHPRLLALLKGSKEMDIDCSAYKGKIDGHIVFKEKAPGPYDSELHLRDIELGLYKSMVDLVGYRLEGILDGDVTYSNEGTLLSDGNGKVVLELLEGQLHLAQPFLGLSTLDLDEVVIESTLKKGIMETTIDLRGGDFTGKLVGKITLQQNPLFSGLTLKGAIEPTPEFLLDNPGFAEGLKLLGNKSSKPKYTLIIFGTLKSPRYKLS